MAVKDKFNFDNIDINSIDPDRVPLGTKQQDCAIIAQAFERGAHATPSEAAVFSTLTRQIQNHKNFSLAIADSLRTYMAAPENDAAAIKAQAENFATDTNVSTTGTIASSDQAMQSLNLDTQRQATHDSDTFGENLMEWMKDCIPCDERIMTWLEVHPHINLLNVFEDYLKDTLGRLNAIADLLNNFSIYGDFCELLNLLSFMCVPDLQRIIALIMALFILEIPTLDGLIGLLQMLIMPIFAPILGVITSLLDQFKLMVTDPIQCVIDAISSQIAKLHIETPQVEVSVENPFQGIESGLEVLNRMLLDGVQQINNKIDFYIDQVKAMLSEVGGGDSAYIVAKLKTLQYIRMISFVKSIIRALEKGHAACSSVGKTPSKQELDSFFDNFLNPNSPFQVYVDEDGQLHIDEEVAGFNDIAAPPNFDSPLPEFGNVFQFEGESVLNTSGISSDLYVQSQDNHVARGVTASASSTSSVSSAFDSVVYERINALSSKLATTSSVVVPCHLETTSENVNQINEWIQQLNQSS